MHFMAQKAALFLRTFSFSEENCPIFPVFPSPVREIIRRNASHARKVCCLLPQICVCMCVCMTHDSLSRLSILYIQKRESPSSYRIHLFLCVRAIYSPYVSLLFLSLSQPFFHESEFFCRRTHSLFFSSLSLFFLRRRDCSAFYELWLFGHPTLSIDIRFAMLYKLLIFLCSAVQKKAH